MIITSQRELEDMLESLSTAKVVFIAGCSECAAVCRTGGEPEVLAMKDVLEAAGKIVSGFVVLEPACHFQKDRRLLKENRRDVERADVILSLSCGNGTQTISRASGKRVVGGNETLFLGEVRRTGHFSKNCILCGQCMLEETDGLCPVARCPKHMLNGPCGGPRDGKCEVDREEDCVWCLVYEKKREKGETDSLKKAVPAKDWSGEGKRSLSAR